MEWFLTATSDDTPPQARPPVVARVNHQSYAVFEHLNWHSSRNTTSCIACMTHLIALLDTAVDLGLIAEVRRVIDLFDSWVPEDTEIHQHRVRLALVPFFAAIQGVPVSAAHMSWEQVQGMQEDLRTNPTLPYFGLHSREFVAVAARVRSAVAQSQRSSPPTAGEATEAPANSKRVTTLLPVASAVPDAGGSA